MVNYSGGSAVRCYIYSTQIYIGDSEGKQGRGKECLRKKGEH